MAAADRLGRAGMSGEAASARQKLPNRYFHLVFSFLMAAAVVSLVTFVVTLTSVGFGGDFLPRWGRAFAAGYCVAVPAIFFMAPRVRALTARFIDAPGSSSH